MAEFSRLRAEVWACSQACLKPKPRASNLVGSLAIAKLPECYTATTDFIQNSDRTQTEVMQKLGRFHAVLMQQ